MKEVSGCSCGRGVTLLQSVKVLYFFYCTFICTRITVNYTGKGIELI